MDEKWKLSKKEGSSSFTRSFSTKSSSSKAPLLRTSSLKSSSPKCPLPRSFSQKNSSISHKCSSLAKEQKARFYIMRRCVAMLVCWHKHGDSWRNMQRDRVRDQVYLLGCFFLLFFLLPSPFLKMDAGFDWTRKFSAIWPRRDWYHRVLLSFLHF
jgi:hypothetical protein